MQTHAAVKPSRQSSAKQRRPQEKKDIGVVQKQVSDLSKADEQKHCPSSTSKTGCHGPIAVSKTSTQLKQD